MFWNVQFNVQGFSDCGQNRRKLLTGKYFVLHFYFHFNLEFKCKTNQKVSVITNGFLCCVFKYNCRVLTISCAFVFGESTLTYRLDRGFQLVPIDSGI